MQLGIGRLSSAEVELVAMLSAVMGLLGWVGLAKGRFHGTLGTMVKSATGLILIT